MKPYDELTPPQWFFRKNLARLVIYGASVSGILWGVTEVARGQDEANASARRIEDTLIDYYRETREQADTAGMASYMRGRLLLADYQRWRQECDTIRLINVINRMVSHSCKL